MKSTDLALRLVMRLALEPADGRAPTTREVADEVGAAYTHLAKVATRLQHLGLVEARRGRGGGLELTIAGRSSSVGAVVRAFEDSGDLTAHVDDDGDWPINTASRLHGALQAAQQAFYMSLEQVSIADIVASPTGPLLLQTGLGGA